MSTHPSGGSIGRLKIAPAVPNDCPAILRLVERNGLTVEGLPKHLETAIVARVGGDLVGCAALELYPDGALLRSVAVDAQVRNNRVGHRLTQVALHFAARRDSPCVILLTLTAENFFSRFGFTRIQRTDVPRGVRESAEFRYACPESAIVMRRDRIELDRNNLAHLTCPDCHAVTAEEMPEDRCLFFWECAQCHVVSRPQPGDCCVFCSYSDRRCPPREEGRCTTNA